MKGKPANVVDSILKGKINKYLAEICLMEQGYVKDEKLTVAQALEDFGRKAGAKIAITDYAYFKVGG